METTYKNLSCEERTMIQLSLEQEMLRSELLPYVASVKIEIKPEGLPDIRDADDIISLALAAVGRADALVRGDGDILAVKTQFHIPTPTIVKLPNWLQAY